MADEIITSDQSSGFKPEEIITSDGTGATVRPPDGTPGNNGFTELSYDDAITKSTREGGLKQVPEGFENKPADNKKQPWMSIDARNPFEVLYLDYRLADLIVPEIVKNNFDILTAFWVKKFSQLNKGLRAVLKDHYGEDRITGAEKKLQDSFDKIKTREGIDLYYREQESIRINAGLLKIAGLIGRTLEDGELTPKTAGLIIAEARANHLTDLEIRSHLQKLLEEQQFTIRTKPAAADLFKNTWRRKDIADPVETSNTLSWLGVSVSSLEEIGEVSFKNKETALTRFRNTSYLPQAVMTLLRNDSKAEIFEKIIEQNKDEEIRYLKIIYRLNPALPFRFQGSLFNNIKALLDNAVQDATGFWRAEALFRSGQLQAWIEETDTFEAFKLTGLQPDTKSFLSFVYQINYNYPFYLEQLRLNNADDLVAALQQNGNLWGQATQYLKSNFISTWLTGIGRNDMNDKYNLQLEPVLQAGWYTEQDRSMAAVQTLLQTLSPNTPAPKIGFDQEAIRLLTIEGTGNFSQDFSLTLQTAGYTAVSLQLNGAPQGISLSEQKFSLFSLNNQLKASVKMNVDVFKLEKDKVYQFTVVASTPYQQLEMPVQLKVVFPAAGFVQQVAIYAGASALFWAVAHIITTGFLGNPYTVSFVQGMVFLAFSAGFLYLYYKIAKRYFNRELIPLNVNIISDTLFKAVLIAIFILSPVARQSTGLWFFFWLFPGATLGAYIACKKYNLNKWLPLIPLGIAFLLGILVKGGDITGGFR